MQVLLAVSHQLGLTQLTHTLLAVRYGLSAGQVHLPIDAS